MISVLRSTGTAALLTAALGAQCQFTGVSMQSYGAGCSEVFGFFPTVRAELDTAACTLNLTVDAYDGCCNTFLQATAVVIGTQPVNVPLPLRDPACALLVQPDIVLVLPGAVPQPFALSLPPTLPPVAFFLQGVAGYYTTISFPRPFALEFALTAGHVVRLS